MDALAARIDAELPSGKPLIPDNQLLPPRVRVSFSSVGSVVTAPPSPSDVLAMLAKNERITAADHWQDVRLVELDLPQDVPAYQAGDVLCLRPENHPHDVARLLERLGWADQADQPIELDTGTQAV